MARNNIIPVYLITGFLESGKTTFINETLADEGFNKGEKTLLILCEEGVEEFDPSIMPKNADVTVHTFENEEEITKESLFALFRKVKPVKVMIEYNGMWQLDNLYNALPDAWQVVQEFMFVDGSTFIAYNNNMRTLMVDKFASAGTVIFNRLAKDFDKMFYHKSVRAVSRSANIIYEYNDEERTVEADNIEDPLPFDINGNPIEIEDKDFAWFYRDIAEDPKKYHGKKVSFKGLCAVDPRFPKGSFVVGRHVMVCCEADTSYRAFACDGFIGSEVENGSWIEITAEIKYTYHKIYQCEGPVLKLRSYKMSTEPDEVIATFM